MIVWKFDKGAVRLCRAGCESSTFVLLAYVRSCKHVSQHEMCLFRVTRVNDYLSESLVDSTKSIKTITTASLQPKRLKVPEYLAINRLIFISKKFNDPDRATNTFHTGMYHETR